MKQEKIILASASPRRRELLTQIGLFYEVMASSAEEVSNAPGPEELVAANASRKAEDIFRKMKTQQAAPFAVIGADTAVFCGGRIFGKPKDAAEAAEMLRALSGGTHQVYTGVCVLRLREDGSEERKQFTERSDVHVAPLSETEIADYIESGEPFDKAGAYAIQGRFARYITGISGDYGTIVGLPVGRLYRECFADGNY